MEGKKERGVGRERQLGENASILGHWFRFPYCLRVVKGQDLWVQRFVGQPIHCFQATKNVPSSRYSTRKSRKKNFGGGGGSKPG